MYRRKRFISLLVLAFFYVLCLSCLAEVCWASGPVQPARTDLKRLDIEELMQIEVSSVSKKPEKLSETAAAVYVITQEDIRRSGATSIPEALRMVPGVQVAHIDANKWAISIRGFDARFANKLLVLMDGRSVYTPLFAGVYWDVQDTLLEDIDRIEVIRGPGGTLWGANAVNGVVNIITKKARDSQGALLTTGSGTEEQWFGAVRYGGRLGDSAHYRFYAKYFDRDNFVDASGDDMPDDWHALRGGFRIDWDKTTNDFLTLQGDIYDGTAGQSLTLSGLLSPPFSRTFADDTEVAGGNVLARWKHVFSDTSDMALQMYYDQTEREDAVLGEIRDTFDIDFQHRFSLGKRQEIVWGLGYRFNSDDIDSTFTLSYDPERQNDHLFNVFLQDEVILVLDRFSLTLGSKLEHNDYTGFEIQPSARMTWTPNERNTVWAAVSRAVRTPSRGEHDMQLRMATFPSADGLLNLMGLFGDSDFDSEELLAWEIGYRLQPKDWLSLDIATFYNQYDNLATAEPSNPFLESGPPPYLVIPFYLDNMMDGEAYGFEISTNMEITDRWRLHAGYAWLNLQLHLDAPSLDTSSELTEGDSPKHQFHLRSYLNLPGNLELDSALYYVDSLPNQDVPSYTRLDARLGWHPCDSLELSLKLENLLDDRHPEFGKQGGANAAEIQRSVYGKITWRF